MGNDGRGLILVENASVETLLRTWYLTRELTLGQESECSLAQSGWRKAGRREVRGTEKWSSRPKVRTR